MKGPGMRSCQNNYIEEREKKGWDTGGEKKQIKTIHGQVIKSIFGENKN